MIYLNNASTTSIKEEVLEEIYNTLKCHWGNPNDIFTFGLKSRSLIDKARAIIAEKINADPEEIIFTCSGSAANTLAIQGICTNNYKKCVTTEIEHNSILLNPNCDPIILVDNNGVVQSNNIDKINLSKYQMISIMYANNELGAINDIQTITQIAHKHKLIMHTDATQYFPHNSIDVKKLDVDLLTFSGHKIGMPSGIGILYKKQGVKLEPLIYGTQERGMFGGTENVAYIVGLGKAVELLNYEETQNIEKIKAYFESSVLSKIPDTLINSANVPRISSISNILFKNCNALALQILLDEENICVSTQSACDSNKIEPSHVLKSIGLSDLEAFSCLRFSFDETTTIEQIDTVVETLSKYVNMLRI